MPREVQCPFCSGSILTKKAGKILSHVSGFLQRSFSIKIPTGILTYLQEHTPVSKKSALKGECAVCKGKGTIKDPSDQTDAYDQVKSKFQSRIKEITSLEAKLGSPAGCGNRYTIIQGSDLLEVGLGMNDAPSYVVHKDKGVRHKGMIGPSKLNEKGAPMFSEGDTAAHVQGINSVASPGGHYMIKCSNKFSLVTGAQGVDITTGGPITISGGITRITGPEITIGTQTGRLTLEGEVVNLNGKSVEVAPSDGHFFVKGTISNTGNLMVGGHTHNESVSFVHGECVGTMKSTKEAAPNDTQTGPPFWGGVGVQGITTAVKDMIGYTTANAADPVSIQGMMGPRFIAGMSDKIKNMTYNMQPWEILPTGFILPGTEIVLAVPEIAFANLTGPANTAGSIGGGGFLTGGFLTATVVNPITLNNFPHSHALPDLKHSHSIRLPDIDCTADNAESLRGKQGGVEQSAPLHKTTSAVKAIEAAFESAVGLAYSAANLALFGPTVYQQKV